MFENYIADVETDRSSAWLTWWVRAYWLISLLPIVMFLYAMLHGNLIDGLSAANLGLFIGLIGVAGGFSVARGNVKAKAFFLGAAVAVGPAIPFYALLGWKLLTAPVGVDY